MARTQVRSQAAVVLLLLVANLLVVNLIARAFNARIDLTADSEYTITQATRDLVETLPDRLTVYGYFSSETHPKLAPLVPRIRDLLEEYRLIAPEKVSVVFVDPRKESERGNEQPEKEASQRFGVRPTPFQLRSKYDAGVKSAYFNLVVAYGDQHQALDFNDIIQVDQGPDGDVVIRLSNLEYEITTAIQKSVRAFGSTEARLAELKEPIEFRVFLTSADLVSDQDEQAKEFLAARRKSLDDVVSQLREKFKEGFVATIEDPSTDAALASELQNRIGIAPLRRGTPAIYASAVVLRGDKGELIPIQGQPGQEDDAFDIKRLVEGAVRRLLPGALQSVGLVSSGPNIPPEMRMRMQMQGQRPPSDGFDTLRQVLRERFEVQDTSLKNGVPPVDVDVLLILAPKVLDDREQFALDQYLMLGGKAIVCLEHGELDMQNATGGIGLKPVGSNIGEVLVAYGVSAQEALVLDDRNMPYPMPVIRDLGGLRIRDVAEVPYPWFVEVTGDGFNRELPVTARLDSTTLLWATPLSVDKAKATALGATVSELMSTSDKAWTNVSITDVQPKLTNPGDRGYTVPEKTERYLLAVAVSGKMQSAFKGKPVPEANPEPDGNSGPGGQGMPSPFGGSGADGGDATPQAPVSAGPQPSGVPAEGAVEEEPSATQFLLEPRAESTDATRLVVVGDADWVGDLGAQLMGRQYNANIALLHNLIDWALLDESLLTIRARGSRDRPLEDLKPQRMRNIELVNYLIPLLLILAAGLVRWKSRRRAEGRRGQASSEATS